MNVEPYLFLEGRCAEALEFYRSALGAEITSMMRFKDSPAPPSPEMCPHGSDDNVMHASFRIGEATIMASDGMCSGKPDIRGVSLSISVASDAEAERIFALLADGGTVQAPLVPTFFSTRFGMVADRFGVPWMLVVMP